MNIRRSWAIAAFLFLLLFQQAWAATNNIRIQSAPSQTLYVIVQTTTGGVVNYWNTSGTPAFEAYNSAHWANYAIAITEGAPGQYSADFPSGIVTAGGYGILPYQQLGGSAATTDNPLPAGSLFWDGSVSINTATVYTRIGAPAGASIEADIAAIKSDSGVIKTATNTGVAPGAAGGLFIAGSNAATTVNFTGNMSGSVGSVTGSVGSVTGAVGSVTGAVGSVTGAVGSVTGLTASNLDVAVSTRLATASYTAPPTAAANATAVWQDATAGDFTTASSIGKSLYNSFTANSSIYTAAALQNAPAASSPTTIATAVWANIPAFESRNWLSGTCTGTNSSTTYNVATTPATAGDYNGHFLEITSGTGVGQSRVITASPLSGAVTVSPPWNTVPGATSTYSIIHNYGYNFGSDNRILLSADSGSGGFLETMQEADRWIDKTTDPTQWQLVLIKQHSGTLGVGTELLRQKLYDVNGAKLKATTTVIGRSITP